MADGMGCMCYARSSSECACDVDWTPKEVIDLQNKVDALEGLVNEVLRCQSWSDINKDHIAVFQEKLKQIQAGE